MHKLILKFTAMTIPQETECMTSLVRRVTTSPAKEQYDLDFEEEIKLNKNLKQYVDNYRKEYEGRREGDEGTVYLCMRTISNKSVVGSLCVITHAGVLSVEDPKYIELHTLFSGQACKTLKPLIW